MDNFDLRKYLAEGRLLKESNNTVRVYISDLDKEVDIDISGATKNQKGLIDYAIEIEEFPALVQQYGIRSVPMTTINDLTYISGLKSEQEFVDKVLRCGVRNESKSTNVQTEDNL